MEQLSRAHRRTVRRDAANASIVGRPGERERTEETPDAITTENLPKLTADTKSKTKGEIKPFSADDVLFLRKRIANKPKSS